MERGQEHGSAWLLARATRRAVHKREMQRSSANAFGFQVPSGVRFLKGRLGRVVASAAAFVLLSVAVGLQPVVEYRDLTCPPGTVVR